mmetsp:Transcript_25084/g.82665  ORF Transcript_25084/g.82665 Transcript_25084/m.82665 type:complete len:214 (+) Transcript_25084:286-927(+)
MVWYFGRAGACVDRAGGPGKYDSASTSNSLSYAENHATCRRSCDVDAFCVGYSVYAPLVGGQVECKTYKAQTSVDMIAGAAPSSGTTCYEKIYSPPPPPPLPPLPPPCAFPDAQCLGQTCGDLIGTSCTNPSLQGLWAGHTCPHCRGCCSVQPPPSPPAAPPPPPPKPPPLPPLSPPAAPPSPPTPPPPTSPPPAPRRAPRWPSARRRRRAAA